MVLKDQGEVDLKLVEGAGIIPLEQVFTNCGKKRQKPVNSSISHEAKVVERHKKSPTGNCKVNFDQRVCTVR
jgi:hypothetical protein